MYDYEYEFDVLPVLRLLKFLHAIAPDTLQTVLHTYSYLSMDDLELCIDPLLWAFFENWEYGVDEFEETEIVRLSHPLIDNVYSTAIQQPDPHGNLKIIWQKRFKIVGFFIDGQTNSVYKQ